jgi:HEAT repeat protein
MRHVLWLFWLLPAVLPAGDAESSAWDVMNHALADGGTAKRIQAITALGSIGPSPRVLDLLEAALSDKEVTVRQTAAAVLGEMKAQKAVPRLKEALDDESAEVSFTAACSLWQIGDQSGRDIFWAVLAGERKTGPGMVEGGMRDAKKKLHSPAALAKIGIEQAASLLGPFSIGVGFAEELVKDKGATARALSAKLLASDPDPRSIQELEQSLDDKNAGVRAAVARALGQRAGRAEIPKLEPLLADGNDGVRYMASAAVIRLSQPPAKPPASRQKRKRPPQAAPAQQPVK